MTVNRYKQSLNYLSQYVLYIDDYCDNEYKFLTIDKYDIIESEYSNKENIKQLFKDCFNSLGDDNQKICELDWENISAAVICLDIITNKPIGMIYTICLKDNNYIQIGINKNYRNKKLSPILFKKIIEIISNLYNTYNKDVNIYWTTGETNVKSNKLAKCFGFNLYETI